MNLAFVVAVGLALYASRASGQNQVGKNIFEGLDQRISDACQPVFNKDRNLAEVTEQFNNECTKAYLTTNENESCHNLQNIISQTASERAAAITKCKEAFKDVYGKVGEEIAKSITVVKE